MAKTGCDYIVVGAGASGCVVASRLSENSSARIILIEAGGHDLNPLFRIPGLGFAAGAVARYNWNFVTEPIAALQDRRMTLLQGKVMGGSGSMNGMVYSRGHSDEYDKWSDMGCAGWGFDDLHPYFLKSESNFRGPGPWHGSDGPIPLRKAKPDLPICDAFLAAANTAGYPIVEDLNANHGEGLGWYDVNIDRGRRINSARGFLDPALKRANLQVLRNTQVTRILISNGRATGVEAMQGGKRLEITADCEVILCGGAIMSPTVLMHSGIGPAENLHQHGIPVIVDAPKTGGNFQNHPCYRPGYACSHPVTARNHTTIPGAVKAGLDYLTRRTGPLAESFASVGGFFKSNPDLSQADMQVVFLSALPPSDGQRIRDLLPREQGFGLTIYQGTPFSRGRVSLGSANPLDQPIVETGYFSDPRDIEILADGVERMREVMRQPEIAKFIKSEVAPGTEVTSKEHLVNEIRQRAGTSYHQCGTCAIGPDHDAVLNLDLKVRGVTGIRVADNSIMPRLPNAALHAPALMIGERAAAMILQDTQS